MADDLVDVRLLREMGLLEGDAAEHLTDLMEILTADARRTLERLRGADSGTVATEAHRLKGASASLAAARLAGEWLALEEVARAGRAGELPRQIDRVLEVLEATRNAFPGAIGKTA